MHNLKPTRQTSLKLKRTLSQYLEEYHVNEMAILAGQYDDESRQSFLLREIKAICNLLHYDYELTMENYYDTQ